MPRKTGGKKVESKDIQGLKYFDQLAPLLSRLHDVGTERDRAGNRQLHMDEYCLLVLLFLFNPAVRSLRAIQQASELKKVQRKLKCPRASLGSLSEATDVFDPERLREVIDELSSQLKPLQRDKRLQDFKQILTVVDGTVIKTLATIAIAAYATSPKDGHRNSKWRLHTQFEIDRYVPTRMDVTGGANRGDQDERYVLGQHLQSDRCYVLDRGYAKFSLFNAIVAAKSSYVCRVRDNSSYEIVEERPLTQEAVKAQVVADYQVTLGKNRPAEDRPSHPVRLVMVKTTPHVNRGKYGRGSTGNASDGYLRMVTNLLDVPAEIITLIYQYRWTIEVFFRFFKHLLGCRHLISTDPVGVEIQAYCAIIACMLISLWTGRKPTQRTYEMVYYYLIGWASEEELLAHVEKLKRHDA
jgi:hypothetical protein